VGIKRITSGDSQALPQDPMPRPVSLRAVSNEKRKADGSSMRRELFGRCRAAVQQMGDEIAGFAVVVWDQNGDMRTSYSAARGPIGPALVPTLVSDALNRHVAVKLAEERLAGNNGSGN
jgi:hypothetical protein